MELLQPLSKSDYPAYTATAGATAGSTTATTIDAPTGVTVNNTTAVNQDEGDDVGHNTIHPVLIATGIIKF